MFFITSEQSTLRLQNIMHFKCFLIDVSSPKVLKTVLEFVHDTGNQVEKRGTYESGWGYPVRALAIAAEIDFSDARKILREMASRKRGGGVRSNYKDPMWGFENKLYKRVLDELGWTIEIEIPFSMLQFNDGELLTWGMNITRFIQRDYETITWVSFPLEVEGVASKYGHLTGLKGIYPPAKFEFKPYSLGGITKYSDIRLLDFEIPNSWNLNYENNPLANMGIDMLYRVNTNSTMTLTLNPDFGQVEADADTIELLDTERFLPERRPFFSEGSELLQMPHRLYYTRRFTDIQAGAKLSGEYKNFNVAFLNIQGETVHGSTREGNSSVFRAVQNIGMKSTDLPGVLVARPGPFTWGTTVEQAVRHAELLEYIAKAACITASLSSPREPNALSTYYLDRHFTRKHGPKAYYGQKDK